jgi:hypothetical protein
MARKTDKPPTPESKTPIALKSGLTDGDETIGLDMIKVCILADSSDLHDTSNSII